MVFVYDVFEFFEVGGREVLVVAVISLYIFVYAV